MDIEYHYVLLEHRRHPAMKYNRCDGIQYDSDHEDNFEGYTNMRQWRGLHQTEGNPEYFGCKKGEWVHMAKKVYICARGHATTKRQAKYYCPLYFRGCKKILKGNGIEGHVFKHVATNALKGSEWLNFPAKGSICSVCPGPVAIGRRTAWETHMKQNKCGGMPIRSPVCTGNAGWAKSWIADQEEKAKAKALEREEKEQALKRAKKEEKEKMNVSNSDDEDSEISAESEDEDNTNEANEANGYSSANSDHEASDEDSVVAQDEDEEVEEEEEELEEEEGANEDLEDDESLSDSQ